MLHVQSADKLRTECKRILLYLNHAGHSGPYVVLYHVCTSTLFIDVSVRFTLYDIRGLKESGHSEEY